MSNHLESLRQIEEVYKDHYPYLKRFLLKLTRDEPLAEDIIQDVFSKILKTPERILDVKHMGSWLVVASRNLLIDHYRKKNPDLLEDGAVIEEMLINHITPENSLLNKQTIHEAMEGLERIDRTIFLAKEQLGYKYEEIAQLVHLPPTTIKARLFRIRKKILANLERSENRL